MSPTALEGHHLALRATLSIPYISATPSSSPSSTDGSTLAIQTNEPASNDNGGGFFSGKATNTWIALAILFLVLCIVSTTSVTVTRFTGMNLFTWISHNNRGSRRRRGRGGAAGDQELMEEVFGGVLRPGRKVKMVKKPKLWDVRMEGWDGQMKDVKAWKSIMPIAARLKRPVTTLPAEPFPNIIISSPAHPASASASGSPHSPHAPSLHSLPSSSSSSPSQRETSSSPNASSSPPSSSSKPRNELQLTVAIAMPVNPALKRPSQPQVPDFALGTVLLPTRCKFKDGSPNTTKPKSKKRTGGSSSTGDVFADLERTARGEQPPDYLPSLARARRGEGNGDEISAEEEAELRRRIMNATIGS